MRRIVALTTMTVVFLAGVSGADARGRGPKKGAAEEKSQLPVPGFSEPTFDDVIQELRAQTRGVSLGRANKGIVYATVEMPLAGPTWRFMSVVASRKTNFGTADLVAILMRASADVAEQFPGSVLTVGNMGLAGGGKIVQSKSHQSGRDVDVAFYALDRKGTPLATGTFVRFNAEGRGSGGLTLDVERTWAFVRAMVSFESPAVQWMFASRGVVDLLLAHAREIGEQDWVVDRARQVLHQPSDSNPHDDHFHIRIHCSEYDMALGCEEFGTQRPWLIRDMSVVEAHVVELRDRALRSEGVDAVAALERLALIRIPSADLAIEALLACDREDVVSAALGVLLSRLGKAEVEKRALSRLKGLKNPVVAGVLMERLSASLSEGVVKVARRLMGAHCGVGDYGPTSQVLCQQCAGVVGRSGDLALAELLISYLEALHPDQARWAEDPLLVLYVGESQAELRHALELDGRERDKSHEKAAKKKGRRKGDKQRSASGEASGEFGAKVTAWRAIAQKVGRCDWKEYARSRLGESGGPLAGKSTGRKSLNALYTLARKGKSPKAHAAAILLSDALGVTMTHVVSGEAATALWGPHMPKATVAAPKKRVKDRTEEYTEP